MIRTVLLGIEIIQWSSVFPISYYTLLLLRIFFDRPETPGLAASLLECGTLVFMAIAMQW